MKQDEMRIHCSSAVECFFSTPKALSCALGTAKIKTIEINKAKGRLLLHLTFGLSIVRHICSESPLGDITAPCAHSYSTTTTGVSSRVAAYTTWASTEPWPRSGHAYADLPLCLQHRVQGLAMMLTLYECLTWRSADILCHTGGWVFRGQSLSRLVIGSTVPLWQPGSSL